jgi:hypothetical protein
MILIIYTISCKILQIYNIFYSLLPVWFLRSHLLLHHCNTSNYCRPLLVSDTN